jgi:hypothetical protein
MKEITCALCKREIILRPSICFDNLGKEFWWEADSKYLWWTNRDSGRAYCEECFSQIFVENEFSGVDV